MLHHEALESISSNSPSSSHVRIVSALSDHLLPSSRSFTYFTAIHVLTTSLIAMMCWYPDPLQRRITNLYNFLDSDQNGSLSRKELNAGLRRLQLVRRVARDSRGLPTYVGFIGQQCEARCLGMCLRMNNYAAPFKNERPISLSFMHVMCHSFQL